MIGGRPNGRGGHYRVMPGSVVIRQGVKCHAADQCANTRGICRRTRQTRRRTDFMLVIVLFLGFGRPRER